MRIPIKVFWVWFVLIGAAAANVFGFIDAALSLRRLRGGGVAAYATLFTTGVLPWGAIGIAAGAYLLYRARTAKGYSFDNLSLGFVGKNLGFVIGMASIACFLIYRFIATPDAWEVRSFALCILLSFAFAIVLPIAIQDTYIWYVEFPDWWSRRKSSKALLAKWNGTAQRGSIIGGINSLAFSADGTTIISCGDGGLRLWNRDGSPSGNPMPIGAPDGSFEAKFFAMSPDGSRIAISDGYCIRMVDYLTRNAVWERPDRERSVEAIAFSHDGKWVAIACNDNNDAGKVLLLDSASGTGDGCEYAKYNVDGQSVPAGLSEVEAMQRLRGHRVTDVSRKQGDLTYKVNDVAFSPDNTEVCFVGGKTEFHEHQRDSVGVICYFGTEGSFNVHGPVFSLEIGTVSSSPTGLCAIGLDHGPVLLAPNPMSLLAEQTRRTLPGGQRGGIFDLCFSDDGALLAGAFADGTARVWDSHSEKLKLTFDLKSKADSHTFAKAVAFSRDGLSLATGNGSGEIFVWDISRVGM